MHLNDFFLLSFKFNGAWYYDKSMVIGCAYTHVFNLLFVSLVCTRHQGEWLMKTHAPVLLPGATGSSNQ